jgi:GTPase SAR1 family protein
MIIDYENRTVGLKIVFFGPAMSGKTTAIRWIFSSLDYAQKLTSVENTVGRTMFMDFGVLPLELGLSWALNLNVWSATGQDFYKSTREVVLVGADGFIFVADAQVRFLDENLASWRELLSFVDESDSQQMPIAVFLNKTDLDDVVVEDRLRGHLSIPDSIPVFAGIAKEGLNVLDTFQWVYQEAMRTALFI